MKLRTRDLVPGLKVPESRLTVVKLDHKDKRGKKILLCECECGNSITVRADSIISGHTISCGCLVKTKQGLSRAPEGMALRNAIARCCNPEHPEFKYYGAKGISVCQRYRGNDGIEKLIQDIGTKPGKGFSIDRINNNGNYCPGNLQWSTQKQQCNNQSSNVMITYSGETLTMAQWAEKLQMHRDTLNTRLKRGWSVEKAFTTPVKQYNKYRELR